MSKGDSISLSVNNPQHGSKNPNWNTTPGSIGAVVQLEVEKEGLASKGIWAFGQYDTDSHKKASVKDLVFAAKEAQHIVAAVCKLL